MLLLYKDLNDRLVDTNRVLLREQNHRFNAEPTPTTTEREVEFGGRLFKSADVEDASRNNVFRSRQTTTESIELQKIEDD